MERKDQAISVRRSSQIVRSDFQDDVKLETHLSHRGRQRALCNFLSTSSIDISDADNGVCVAGGRLLVSRSEQILYFCK